MTLALGWIRQVDRPGHLPLTGILILSEDRAIPLKYFVLVLFAIGTAVSTLVDESSETVKRFVHPGLLHSRTELKFIQQKIDTGQQPWMSAWQQLQSAEEASLHYTPRPFAKVVRGVRNNPNWNSL